MTMSFIMPNGSGGWYFIGPNKQLVDGTYHHVSAAWLSLKEKGVRPA